MIAIGRLLLATPWTYVVIAFLASNAFSYSKGWMIEHDAKIAAVAALDADWRSKLETANHEAENEAVKRAQEAVEAASRVAPAGPTPADLARLCATDSACRDRQHASR